MAGRLREGRYIEVRLYSNQFKIVFTDFVVLFKESIGDQNVLVDERVPKYVFDIGMKCVNKHLCIVLT